MSQVADLQAKEGIPEQVSAALSDPDAQVRVAAVESLSKCSPEPAITRLIALGKRDPEQKVRCAALAGLGELLYMCGASAYDPETDPDDLLRCEGLPIEDVKHAFQFLLDAYHSPKRTPSERRTALEAVSCFCNPKVEDAIADLYQQPDKESRISALVSMGRNGSSRWLEPMRRNLYHDDQEVQLLAVLAAGELGHDGLGKDLLHLTYAQDRELMMAALWSLGQTAWEGAFDRLDECTLHEDPEISEVADNALDEWLFFTGLDTAELGDDLPGDDPDDLDLE
jgi:HEAT repeat protein